MGLLQDGKWVDQWYDTKSTGGRFERKLPQFRSWVTRDGSAGPTGEAGFKAESDRYHLYVSLACPWAHRTLIFRELKGLQDMIPISIVHWFMADKGWTFESGDGVVPDDVNQAQYMYEIYTAAMSDYSGRVTVPVLWDKKTNTIVSNESPEIIRMLNSAFDGVGAKPRDLYPIANHLLTEQTCAGNPCDAVDPMVTHHRASGQHSWHVRSCPRSTQSCEACVSNFWQPLIGLADGDQRHSWA